jgi:hypothetical protein
VNDIVLGRVLAALRFQDAATSAMIVSPLSVSAPGTRFVRNRRGFYVITRCQALPRYDEADPDAPDTPLPGSVRLPVTIVDHSRRYLARTVVVPLPRGADPGLAEEPDSVFRPLSVALFPSPLAQLEPGLALIRVSVRASGSDRGLAHAFIRVHRAGDDGALLGAGLCDARGEGLVAIAGIPSVNFSSDPQHPVLADSVAAAVQVFFDSRAGETPNPTEIEERRATLPNASVAVSLAPSREVFARVEVVLP